MRPAESPSHRPTSGSPRLPRDLLLHTAIVSSSVVAVRAITGPLIIDDAYITFRYSQHIAGGLGWVFNPGERVIGSSSPLLAILLAAASAAGVDLPNFSYGLGIASAVATAVTLLLLGRRLGGAVVQLPASSTFIVWAACMALGFSILNRYLFPRYLAPLFPVSLLLTTIGISTILKSSSGRWAPKFRRVYSLAVGSLVVAIALGLGLGMLGAGLATTRDISIREAGYGRAGTWILSHLGPDAAVAAVEIGALGYAYPGTIPDLTGPVTPASLPYYASGDFSFRFPHDVPAGVVSDLQPPVLVVLDGFVGSGLATPDFHSEYCPVYGESATHHAYGILIVFIRPSAFAGSSTMCLTRRPQPGREG